MTSEHSIRKVTVRLIRVPVDPPAGDAIQQFDTLEIPLVQIEERSGLQGTGFGYTIGNGGSAIVELLRKELVTHLVGRDAREIGVTMEFLKKKIHALTPGVISSNALAAIDIGLWDLAGKRSSTPLHRLLGGAKNEVPIYNTDVGWLSRSPSEMIDLSTKAVKEGFRALKLKVGKPDPEEDRERIAKVREAVGKEIHIMIDANQSWTVPEAISRLRNLESYDLGWIEEPIAATDLEGLEKLARNISIPIAGGESLYDPANFFECARRGVLDIFQPDVARIGGITKAIQVCHLAEAANVPVSPHVSPELSLVVAAAVNNSIYIEYIPQMEVLLKRTIRIENGMAVTSKLPGHGIDFDEEALELFEVKDANSEEVAA